VLAAEQFEAIRFIIEHPEYIAASEAPKLIIDHIRRDFQPEWRGSRYAVLAALEASAGDTVEGSIWQRRANAEMRAWCDRQAKDRNDGGPGITDCVNVAVATAICSGVAAFLREVGGWQPATWRYRVAWHSASSIARSNQELFQQVLGAAHSDPLVLLAIIGVAAGTRSSIRADPLRSLAAFGLTSVDELFEEERRAYNADTNSGVNRRAGTLFQWLSWRSDMTLS
jgi:hypothetical protein